MKIHQTPLSGLLLLEHPYFTDDRGNFSVSFNKEDFRKAGIEAEFIQDNQSVSRKGVIRGLHFQKDPFAQGKLVKVVKGNALDVVVDIRKGSATFGRYYSVELTGENGLMLWIPPGFAHGFSVLEDDTIFQYKVTAVYNPHAETGIIYNDISLNIDWKVQDPVVSAKDRVLPSFREFCLANDL